MRRPCATHARELVGCAEPSPTVLARLPKGSGTNRPEPEAEASALTPFGPTHRFSIDGLLLRRRRRRLAAELLKVLFDHFLGRLRQALDFNRLRRVLDGLADVPGHLDA